MNLPFYNNPSRRGLNHRLQPGAANEKTLKQNTMNTANTTATLEQIGRHLADALNGRYSTGPSEEYLIPGLGQFGTLESNSNEFSIELPYDIADHKRAMCAVATLLQKSGSEAVWVSDRSDTENPWGHPLRLSLVKRAAWAGSFWQWARYLVIDHIDDDLDVDAATRQIALLVNFLEDQANLIPLDAEVRELF